MYSFEKAICLSRSIGSQWKEVDISEILVYDIFNTYSKVFLVLYNSVLDVEQNVDMDVLKAEYSSFAGTLESLLVLLGNTTLETVATLPSSSVKYVKYSDAARSEYKVELAISGRILPENFPDAEKQDLVVTRPKYNTSMDLLHTHCLVSVNGYIHKTGYADGKAYVFQGATTMRKSKVNHLGITSFLDVGRLEKIDLDPLRISAMNAGGSLYDKLTFQVDGDFENKSYFLVLGGYLIFPEDNVFFRNNTSSFVLDLNKIPYLERLFESKNFIDLSPLGLTPNQISSTAYDLEELTSDAVIKKYMTLSQSFFVSVDVPHLVTNKIHLRHSSMPGMFTAYQDPVYPLVVSNGRLAEYWKVEEDGFWAVNVQDSFFRNMIISQQPTRTLDIVNDHLLSNKPFFHGRGFLLEIAGYRNN